MKPFSTLIPLLSLIGLAACGSSDEDPSSSPLSPDDAPVVAVDRFGAGAMLQSRAANPDLPGADEPVDFDREPFITQGLSPDGAPVRYYNFDVQSNEPAALYVLTRSGENAPVEGQLDIVDVLPGMAGYSDFFRVMNVTVPADYVANAASSAADLEAAGYAIQASDRIYNRPIVPAGSSAPQRLGSAPAGLQRAWYQGGVVSAFLFDEAPLRGERVPLAPIYVSFNLNPDVAGGGPASGFRVEPGSTQTHNVLSALPGDDGYSPLWSVSVYDRESFDAVADLDDVQSANVLARGVASVNCPVVELVE